MQPKTKKYISSLTKKPTTTISEKKKPPNCWRIRETKKKTDLRTMMLNRTMESNKNPNYARFVFSLLLRFHYNTRLLPFSPFFLSPFFLFPFFLSFPFLHFCLLYAKKTYFLTLSIFMPTPTL